MVRIFIYQSQDSFEFQTPNGLIFGGQAAVLCILFAFEFQSKNDNVKFPIRSEKS